MKTRNAFAFRDFDATRILQRPFFKKLREVYPVIEDRNDEELFKADARPLVELPVLEMKLNVLDELLIWVTKYQKHLERHGERLTRYARAVAIKLATDENTDIATLRAKHRRANELLMKYCGYQILSFGKVKISDITSAAEHVGELFKKIVSLYKDVDEYIKGSYRKTFADRLKFARQKTGLSQRAFAPKLNMSQNGYALYETGQRDPSIPTLIRLSKILNRSVDWLLGQTAW